MSEHESHWARSAKASSDTAKELCENEKVQNFASGIASTVAGTAVGIATGNAALGTAASGAVSGLSRSHKKEVAETVTTVATDFAMAGGLFIALFKLPLDWLRGKL